MGRLCHGFGKRRASFTIQNEGKKMPILFFLSLPTDRVSAWPSDDQAWNLKENFSSPALGRNQIVMVDQILQKLRILFGAADWIKLFP
jgi:hypothetical protein